MKNRLTVMSFMLAIVVALAAMPTDFYQICGMGTRHRTYRAVGSLHRRCV